MSNIKANKGTIAILTGGGDVPGLNPAIRAITVRALREGYRVLGIRRGWAGLVELERDKDKPQDDLVIELSEEIVNRAGRTGGTFLHTSRTRPQQGAAGAAPAAPEGQVPGRDRRRHAGRAGQPRSGSASTPSSRSAATTRSPTACDCTRRGYGHRDPQDDGQRRRREPTTASASPPASPAPSR